MGQHRVVRLTLAALVIVGGCTTNSDRDAFTSALDDDAITVGSFDFAESTVLAEIYSQALEAEGYPVVRAFGLGPREFVAPALVRGLIEMVPEYAGTATAFFSMGDVEPSKIVGVTHDQLRSVAEPSRVTVLDAAPAQDSNAFVVTRETADRFALRTISDLQRHAGKLRLGGPAECPSRPLCGLGLRDVYDLQFGEFIPLNRFAVTRQALSAGAIDVGLLLSTDPAIDGENLVELVDDRDLQPPENITPMLRTEVLDRWGPEVATTIDKVSAVLTSSDVQALNEAMDVEGAVVANVAADWLRSKGLA